MFNDLIRELGKLISLIKPSHMNAAAIAVIALLGAGIGTTLFSSPDTVDLQPQQLTEKARPSTVLLERPKKVAVPKSIGARNIFRRQRTGFKIKPPPPPPPPPPPESELLEKTEYITEGIKLLGTIVTDNSRIAILEAEITETVQEFVEQEIEEVDLVLSGARQGKLGDDGRYYEKVSVQTAKVHLDTQTFYEGDAVSNYVIERINEDSIEIAHLLTGRREIVRFVIPQASNKGKGKKGKAKSGHKKEKKKKVLTDEQLSGARTRAHR